MSKSENVPIMTTEMGKEILSKTVEELKKPENAQRLEEARDNVGNEMLKMMQFVFPIVMQVLATVIHEFGFPEGREGLIKFAEMIRSGEREDPEVARLHSIIKGYYLPSLASVSVNMSSTNESPAED